MSYSTTPLSDAEQAAALARSPTSPYKQAHAIMIGWRSDSADMVEHLEYMGQVLGSYGYKITVILGDDEATLAVPRVTTPGRAELNEGVSRKFVEVMEEYDLDADIRDVRETLIVVCYFGHGGKLTTEDGDKWLFGFSPNGDRIVPLSDFMRQARDITYGCDMVFMLDCCLGDDHGLQDPFYYNDEQNADSTFVEVVAAGEGVVYSGRGHQDWLMRYAHNMVDFPVGLTVKERARMVYEGENVKSPGLWYQLDENYEGDIILAPLMLSPASRNAGVVVSGSVRIQEVLKD